MFAFLFVSLQRLIVCLEESLYIHNIRDMKVLHTIRETPPNPAGERVVGRKAHFLILPFTYFNFVLERERTYVQGRGRKRGRDFWAGSTPVRSLTRDSVPQPWLVT